MSITSRSNGTLINKKPFKGLVCLVTLVAFLCNTVLFDAAWAVGTPSALPGRGADRAGGSGSLKELHVDTFTLPEYLGHIKYQHKANSPNKTIIHIQDAHCNYAAQQKISEIIGYLTKEYGVNSINLEGGAKDYDLSVFNNIANRTIRDRVADYFVKEGLVNGAEYFAINNPEKVSLWGIEDTKLYVENLKVYRDSLAHKEEVDKHLKVLSHVLSNLKSKIYSQELLDFDMKYGAYKANNVEFKDYLSFLISIAKSKAIDIKSLPNIYLMNQTLGEEGGIDFKKANNERDELIDNLQKRLSKKALEVLVVKTVEFKAERISQKDFYAYLTATAKQIKLELNTLPELQKYIVYISMYDAIDKTKVMEEMDALENTVRDTLCRNNDERTLSKLSKNLSLLKNIFGITLTKDDYKYYKANEESFDMRNFSEFINKNAPLYSITAKLDNNVQNLNRYRQEIERFYEYSLKRDGAFIKNLQFAISGKQPTKAAILVTGGFHTENLAELFKGQGISYISIMPNFKNRDGYECPYFNLLRGETTRSGHVVYSAFTSLSLSTMAVAALSTALGKEVWSERNIDAFKAWVGLETIAIRDGWDINRVIRITKKDKEHLEITLDTKEAPITVVINDLFHQAGEAIDTQMAKGGFFEIGVSDPNRIEAIELARQLNKDVEGGIENLSKGAQREGHRLYIQEASDLPEGQNEHVGGWGVSIRHGLNGNEKTEAILHGILAGFIENHQTVVKIVEALMGNNIPEARRLFIGADKHRVGSNIVALWDMTSTQRQALASRRDFATASEEHDQRRMQEPFPGLSTAALEEWHKKYKEANEVINPTWITTKNYQYGIASRENYPKIYEVLDRIVTRNFNAMKKIWPNIELPQAPPAIFLLETDEFQCFYSRISNFICISVGFMQFLQKYADTLKEEDIAFAVAHELGHFVQSVLKIESKTKMDRHAKEYDADARALTIMNRAGYSVDNIERIFEYFKKHGLDMKEDPKKNRDRKAAIVDEMLTMIKNPSEDSGRAILKQRARYFALIREAMATTPSFKAIRGEEGGPMRYNSGWGGYVFTGTDGQQRHLRYRDGDSGKGYRTIFNRDDNPFENVATLDDEEFVKRLKRDAEILQVILEAYQINLRTERIRIYNPIPYMESHPITEERKVAIIKNRKSVFMGSYDNRTPDLSYLDKEISQPTEHQKNIKAIERVQGMSAISERENIIVNRFGEIKEWQEAIYFLAYLDPAFRTESLYAQIVKRVDSIPNDVEKVLFLHQVNFMYGKKEENAKLPIETDRIWFHKYAPLSFKDEMKRGGDEISQACAKNVSKFRIDYHKGYSSYISNLTSEKFYPGYGQHFKSLNEFLEVFDIYMERQTKYSEGGLWASGLNDIGQLIYVAVGYVFPFLDSQFQKEWVKELTYDKKMEILGFYFKCNSYMNSDQRYHWLERTVYPILRDSFKNNAELFKTAKKQGWDLTILGNIYLSEQGKESWEEELEIKINNPDRYGPSVDVGNMLYKYTDKVPNKERFIIDFIKRLGKLISEKGLNKEGVVSMDAVYMALSGVIREELEKLHDTFDEAVEIPKAYTNGVYIFDNNVMRFLKDELDKRRAFLLEVKTTDGNIWRIKEIKELHFSDTALYPRCDFILEDGSEKKGYPSTGISEITLHRRNIDHYPKQVEFFKEMKVILKEGLFKANPELIDGLKSPYSVALLLMISNGMIVKRAFLEKDWFLNMPPEEIARLLDIMQNHIPRAHLEKMNMLQIHIPTLKGVRYASSSIDTFDQYLSVIYHLMIEKRIAGYKANDGILAGEVGADYDSGSDYILLDSFAKGYAEEAPFWRRRTAPSQTVEKKYNGKPVGQGITIDFVKNREKEFLSILVMKGVLKSEDEWEKIPWQEIVKTVEQNMPPSVLRNYLLCYLFAERVLSGKTKFNMDRLFEFDEITQAVTRLNDKKRAEIRDEFIIMSKLFIMDEYVRNLNENIVERYFAKEKFKRFPIESEPRPKLEMTGSDAAAYKRESGYFQPDFRYSESGTPLSQVDLSLANMFSDDLEKDIQKGDKNPSEILNEIAMIYTRASNTRDRLLMLCLETYKNKLNIKELEQVIKLANSENARDKVALLALQLTVDNIIKAKGNISFSEEADLIKKYFPEPSYFRDDILNNFERSNNVTSSEEVMAIRSLRSFDPEHFTDEAVKKRVEAEDNLIMMLDMVGPGEKSNVILWLAGVNVEKPNFFKKMELLHYTNVDYLRSMETENTTRYKQIGNTYRKKLLEAVLRRGEESIIAKGRTLEFVRLLWGSTLQEFKIKDSQEIKVMYSILNSLFTHLKGEDVRTVKILTDFMLALDNLRKDKDFSKLSDAKKTAILMRTFLGSLGVIGIKLAQYLATSTSFGLSPEFKDVLLDLTEGAEGVDKTVIFSVIHELKQELESNEALKAKFGAGFKVEDIQIKEILAAASIKTCFVPQVIINGKPLDMQEVWKVKNMAAVYDAQKDLDILQLVTTDLVEERLIDSRQQEDLMKEMRGILEEELNFNLEKSNTETMRQRVSERKPVAEAPLLYRFVKTIAGDLSSYNIAYTQVYETARNVLIREKFVRGVSLRTYMKDPAKTKQVKKIKKVLTLELIRQIFEDGIYHADLHPGNVMIYENPNGKIDITIIDMGGVTRISESEKQKVEKLFTKILRWKAKSFIYPFAKLDVSRELGDLSFKSQKFLDKVSYLFGEKRLVSSAAKRSEKEVAKETPASAPLESLTGIDDIMDVFPVLRTVKMLRGQTARIDRLIGKRLTVKASWLVLGSKEPAQPGNDFTGILKKVYVTKRGDGYATLNLHFNNFSGISPRMSYLERMKDAGHTFEINIMDRDGNWVANSNLIITSIEEAREGGELSPIGLSDGGAIAQLTPAGIELRDEIQMSDELKNWNIRHEEWHNWANNNIRLPDVSSDRQKAISEAVAIILAFRGMKEINDTHLKALLAAVGANPDAISSDLTDMDLIKGVVRYLAETRPGYEGALSGSEETIIAFIRQALVVAPQPATVVNSKDALYGAAQKTIPQIMEVINKNSPTFDTAPAPEDDISPTTNCDRSVEQLLGKEGHAIYARHYKVGKTAEESFNNLLSHMEKSDIIQKFDAAVKSNPSSRWMVRVLSLDAKSRVERHIKQELVKLNTNEAGKVDENAVANAFNRIHVMVETVKDAAHLNTVIDLFVDIGIMELDRYTQGDYEGQATVEFKNDLANLLRLSVTNLENLSGNTLEEILKKIFEGSVILMIKAIDWKSIQEWKKSQDEVLRAL